MPIYFFYSLSLFFAILFYAPFYIIKIRKGGAYKPDLLERLGFSLLKAPRKRGFRILFHSVSVGETKAIIPVIREFKARCPDWEIYMTATTGTGRKAAEQAGGGVDGVLYFPIDFGLICASFLRRVSPDCICLTETEIWPNFVRMASGYNIPLVLINGRISDKSYRNYAIVKPFVRMILNRFALFCMQSEMDARRIMNLGASPEKVRITGNIKFDMGQGSLTEDDGQGIRMRLGLAERQRVLVAGSTHPGEEKPALDAFARLLNKYPDLVFVLAPRHIERSEEIARMIKARNKEFIYWSRLSQDGPVKGGQVILIDVIGELARIYSIADMVFIGGSLIPHGGQNPLEPAFYGKPILFGPHMENFRQISRMLLDKGAAVMIDFGNFTDAVSSLFADESRMERMGRAAKAVIDENKGAANRTCDQVLDLLRAVCK
ncbi:3-deoxy-D-manno-octulosonic acid transferase [bacterium]|nr:3-deoxy-D-manno-octulosonic acid transferase [bacterium]